MKHNKCLLLLTLVGSMGLVACGGKTSDPTHSGSDTQVDYKSKLEMALEKDYSNMTVEVVSVYDGGEQSEAYYEYYYNDYIVVYSPDVAEMGYDPYSFYHDYNGENYLYFTADRPNDPTSTAAWLKEGYVDTIKYDIKYAYFDMDELLNNVDPKDAVYQSGMYIISDAEVVSGLNQTLFGTFFFNDIEYVVLNVGNDGYLSQVIGLQELDNEDDFVQIKFGYIGETTVPTTLPEAPNETNVMEYWQYKGWDGPYVETYVDSLTLTPNKALDNDVLVMEIEEVVQAIYTFEPANANQAKDWRLHSTNENVAVINFDYDGPNGEKRVKITAVGEGDAEVYIRARGQSGIDTGVESNHISVHVNPIQEQNLEGMVYDLTFTGLTSDGTLGVANALNNNLPVSATTTKASINSGNSDLFGNDQTLLLNPGENGTGSATVTFDFDDQQVSSISLYYGLYWPADMTNASWINTITLDTSNDGVEWNSLDIKDEVLHNISSENFKLLEKEFAPASKVRISITSGFVGKAFRFSFSRVAFMANDSCHDHEEVIDIPVESVVISSNATTVKCGKSLTIGYVVNPTNATNQSLTWHSSNEDVATFTNNLLTASATNAGTTEIYAKAANGVESNRLTITVEAVPALDTRLLGTWLGDDYVTRVKLTFTETSVTALVSASSNEEQFVLNYEDKEGNTYAFKDSNSNELYVSYSSSNEIYVQAKLGEVYINRYTHNYNIYRYIPATSITLSSTKTTLNVGDTTSISISYNPTTATGIGVTDEITWTADQEGIVEFNNTTSGTTSLFVRAIGAGTVVITATNGDGINDSITLTVNEPVKVSSIAISSATGSNEVEVNGTLTLTATVTGVGGETPANSEVTWSSSNSSVASVSSTGVVTGKVASDDLVTITATARDGSGVYGTFEVKVIDATTAIPSGLVGTWTGVDSMMSCTINITITEDGNLTLENADTAEVFEFTLTSISGNSYTFEDEEGNVMVVQFDARYPDEAKFELNDGEMSTDSYIVISSYDEYTKQ